MLRRILVADLLITGLLIFGGIRVRKEWRAFDQSHTIGQIRSRPETFAALPSLPSRQPQSDQWSNIATQNPFSFDRNDATLPAPVPPPAPPPVNVGPKPTLFGTFSMGTSKVAMLAQGHPGNRDARPMRVGEVIDGWELVEIKDGTVAVRAGERVETVVTNDPSAQVPRVASVASNTPAAAPAVSATIQSTTSPGTPSQPVTVKSAVPVATTSNSNLPPDIHPAPGAFIPTKEQEREGSWVKTPRGDVFVFNPGL